MPEGIGYPSGTRTTADAIAEGRLKKGRSKIKKKKKDIIKKFLKS